MLSTSFQQIYAKLKFDIRIRKPESIESTKKLSKSDFFAFGIATCGGVGYLPVVPATWGSLIGVGIYLIAQKSSESFAVWADGQQFSIVLLESVRVSSVLFLLICLFLIGVWSAARVEKITGKKDPGIVVIDEVVGQLIAFLFVPARLGWWTVLVGFLAFRAFDIFKPFPTDKFEALPEGLGVMADDAMAGFYTAAFMALVCTIYLFIW